MPTIAGQGITRGVVRTREQGDWFGEVFTNSSERIPDGTRVELVVENVTRFGAIVRGNITNAVGRYQLAGRPEWESSVAPRGYQSSASVLRNTVLSDLCRDTLGANFASIVVLPAQKGLGRHYERFGPTARDVVAKLELPWYVRDDGVTVFAARPSGEVTTEQRVLVSYRNDANGLRVINCEDIAAFVPGLTFESEVLGEVTYVITAEDVTIHAWPRASSSAFAAALRAVFRRVFPRLDLSGTYEYVAKGPRLDGGWDLVPHLRTDLPPVGMSTMAPFMWTVAGHSADLAPATHVLVVFADGDPARPKIVAIDPSTLPTNWAVDVAGLGTIDLADAAAPVVRYGDTVAIAGAQPAAGIISFTPGIPPTAPALPSRVNA